MKTLVKPIRPKPAISEEFPGGLPAAGKKKQLGPIGQLLDNATAKQKMNQLLELKGHATVSARAVFADKDFHASLEQLHGGHAVNERLLQKLLYEKGEHHDSFVGLLDRVARRLKK